MYVIFTSGSTGTPKGCVTEHGAFCSSMYEFGRGTGLNTESQVLQFASYSFDTSLEEIFCTLFAGATLHVPSEERRMNDLAGEIQRTKTNWAELNPKVASLLNPDEVPTLKTIILGGDRSHGSDVSRWPESTKLLNSYGCSEASVTSTLILLGRQNDEPPIGKGVGCRLWIVHKDNHHVLAPIGAPGELLIEGPGLARAYLGDHQRTARSFISNPKWAHDGSGEHRRFYKTGDLVRYRADGAVMYIGRNDTQVKVRGQRVELGEIEHQLARVLPDCHVAAEVPTIQNGASFTPTLAAFYVLPSLRHTNDVPTVLDDPLMLKSLAAKWSTWTAELSRTLPIYMVPDIFIPLTKMPLTVSAKTDRRKLRALAQEISEEQLMALQGREDVKQPPETEAEVTMQAAWAEVLKVQAETIGRNDHFIRIGGDSLLAMKMVPAARKLGLRTSVADVFQTPVLKDLATKSELLVSKSDESDWVDVESPAPFSLLDASATQQYEFRRAAAEQCKLLNHEIEDLYPCTPLQEGLMFLSAKQHGSYVAQMVLELESDIDMATFIAAWEKTVQAHPILRTRIVSVGSTLLQAVTTKSPIWDTDADLDHYLFRDAQRVVEPGTPLSRFAIIPYSDRYLFAWTLHHCVYDGWSLPIILQHFATSYSGNIQDKDAVPSFSRFIKYIGTQEKDVARQYWATYLAGASTMFPQPQRSRQQVEPDSTMTDHLNFPVRAVDGITPAILLRTAWALLTRSYTGVSDVVFGTTVTGRNAPVSGVELMSGPTIATIPVRIRWGSKTQGSHVYGSTMTVRELLEQVQQEATEVIPYEQTGLHNIARINDDARAATQFEALFVVHPGESDDEEIQCISGLMKPFRDTLQARDRSRFSTQGLLVECTTTATDGRVFIHFSFSSHVISAEQVSLLAQRFQHILRQLVDGDSLDVPVENLNLVSPRDRELMDSWNTDKVNPIQRTMHDLVSESAKAHPRKQAIAAWDGAMTFAELDALTSQIAARLRQLGVGKSSRKDELVLLSFEKSRWGILSMLAIHKAGAAFVALDPANPDGRLATIMELSKARFVLTSPSLSSRIKNISSGSFNVICTAELANQETADTIVHRHLELNRSTVGQPERDEDVKTVPEDIAYVIFTSGSTGVPKGVIISHGAASSSIISHGRAFGVTSTDRTLQFSSLAFDACIFEIFTTLVKGGCVCIPSDAQRVNDLPGAIASMSVNTVMLTPSVLALLSPTTVPTVKMVIFIAEQVTDGDIKRWRGRCRVLNGYGPTECTVVCVVNSDLKDGGCIGRAVGCRAWVVEPDNHDKLLPVGCTGELLVEGPSLARGYMNDAERTDASFIYNPAWSVSTAKSASQPRRFYKTGDLVRQTDDGAFMYLGRKDAQVKLRGQRIELDEIAHHIQRAIPGAEVRTDVVQPQTQETGGTPGAVIVAFVAMPESKTGLDTVGSAEEIESLGGFSRAVKVAMRELTRALPSYMVPSIFIPLTQIPLTVSGKTDRQQLKALAAKLSPKDRELLRSIQRGTFAKGTVTSLRNSKMIPRTNAEQSMREAWATVLKLEDIGIEDNFFQLGGDSISAMKLVPAARALGLDITVAQVFQSPVLADLCGSASGYASQNGKPHIEQGSVEPFCLLPADENTESLKHEAANQCGVKLEDIDDLYPCTSLQEGLMSLSIKEGGSYIIREVFQLRKIRLDAFKEAWEQTVAAHPVLRTRIVHLSNGDMLQAVVSAQRGVSWRQASTINEYMAQDKEDGIEFGSPFSRFGLVGVDDDRNKQGMLFVWTIHHAIYDGWSMPIIKEAVSATYEGLEVEEPLHFNRFIQHLSNVDLDAANGFWRSYLDGACASPFPAAPGGLSDFEHYAANSVIQQACDLSGEHPGSIIGREATMSTLLRVAYSLVVGAYTNSRDVVFGTTLSGRNVPIAGVERMTGPTIATVPIRVRWDAVASVRDLLARAQNESTDMMPYEQLGLQRISGLSASAREAIGFQSLFVVQPAPGDEDEAYKQLFGHQLDERAVQGDEETPQTYPFGLEASTYSNQLHLKATFDKRAVDSAQVRRILSQLERTVTLLLDNPDIAVSSLDMASSLDKKDIRRWNSQNPPKAIRDPIHELFHQHAVKRPDAVAVSAWDGAFTFSELDRLSNGVANRLRAHGIGSVAEREDIVPFSLQKSKWVPVTMLAILKAGGAFIALDSTQPIGRLRLIAERIGANILLTSPALSQHPSLVGLGLQAVFPSDLILTPEEQDDPPKPRASARDPADSLAYVIFTFGSTGTPKGVLMPHTAAASSILAHGSAMGMRDTSRVLQFAAYIFDACVLETLGPLMIGACVCIPSRDECDTDLTAAVQKYGVNFFALAPRVASLLRPEELPAVTDIALGAETVSEADIQRWKGRRISNGYGPTECAVVCVLESETHRPGRIGQGVGCLCWIVGAEDPNKLAPVGAPGELLIEGPCLARGYLDEKEQTDEAFIYNLDWTKEMPGSDFGSQSANLERRERRFYKTGDLVRYDCDGGLIFIGRKDSQVKLRGQRIELGEVEHHLGHLMPTYHHIAHVVDVPQQSSDSKALVAFISLNKASNEAASNPEAESHGIADLDDHAIQDVLQAWSTTSQKLAKIVPSYMVPSMCIPISSVPLTSSGKTDSRRLQAIAASLSASNLELLRGSRGIKEPPRTSTEKLMQAAWSKTLGLDPSKIGIRDSFFRLGGDSISAMRLVPIAAVMGLSIRLSDVFRTPVLEDLCGQLQDCTSSESGTSADATPSSIPAQTPGTPVDYLLHDSSKQLNLVPAITTPSIHQGLGIHDGSNFNLHQLAPATDFQALAYEFATYRIRGFVNYFIFKFHSRFSVERVYTAAKHLVRCYAILRTSFRVVNDRLMQVVASAEAAQPCVEVFLVPSGADMNAFPTKLIEMDEARRLPAGENPTKFFVLETSSPSGVSASHLVLRLAHTHYDGLSFPFMLGTLSDVLLSGKEGFASRGGISFADFAIAQMAQLSNQSLMYWRELLQGSHLTMALTPAAVAANDGNEGLLTREIPLPNLENADIPFITVLKAAWAVVLAQHTHKTDVVFGCLVSGRTSNIREADKIVGPCLNIVPVRADTSSNGSTRDFVRAVHAQHLNTMEHEQVGFRHITSQCTFWPSRTSFAGGTVIQHQGIHVATLLDTSKPVNGMPFVLSGQGRNANAAAVWIITTPHVASATVSVELYYAVRAIPEHVAHSLLHGLCAAVAHFTQNWNHKVPLPSGLVKWWLKDPVLPCGDEVTKTSEEMEGEVPTCEVVDEAWARLSKAHSKTAGGPVEHPYSMFDIWDDNLVAVELREIYEDLGVYLDLEQLLQCPTMRGQKVMLG